MKPSGNGLLKGNVSSRNVRRTQSSSEQPALARRGHANATNQNDNPNENSPQPSPTADRPQPAAYETRGERKQQSRGYSVETTVQTDASFIPSALNLQDQLGELSTSHWLTLKCLKEALMGTVTNLAGSLYDVIAFKNVAAQLPGFGYGSASPMTDLILLSSRLHRVVSLLTRQLAAFFDTVFSEDVADELFHFTEMRLTKKKLIDVSSELAESKEEVANLQSRVRTLEAREAQQRQALDTLETNHTGLEMKSASLEEQMALLFEQLADDYIYYNEDELNAVSEDAKLHERLAPIRSAFSHSIDAVQQRLRFFQDMLAEVGVEASTREAVEDLASPIGARANKGEKAKLRSLEVHLHHLTSRFNSVREGLHQTARDLHIALSDKKRILNLSVHHLKSYEMQNSKLQAIRAKLCDLRKAVGVFQSTFRGACPKGTLLTVDHTGRITHYTRRAGGGDEVTQADASLADMYASLNQVQLNVDSVTDTATTSDEHKHLMKIVSMSVPSGQIRKEVANNAHLIEPKSPGHIKSDTKEVNDALHRRKEEGGTDDESAHISRIKSEYNGKLSFLREVYEDRVKALEAKVEMLLKKLASGCSSPEEVQSDYDLAQQSRKKWLQTREALLEDGEQDRKHELLETFNQNATGARMEPPPEDSARRVAVGEEGSSEATESEHDDADVPATVHSARSSVLASPVGSRAQSLRQSLGSHRSAKPSMHSLYTEEDDVNSLAPGTFASEFGGKNLSAEGGQMLQGGAGAGGGGGGKRPSSSTEGGQMQGGSVGGALHDHVDSVD